MLLHFLLKFFLFSLNLLKLFLKFFKLKKIFNKNFFFFFFFYKNNKGKFHKKFKIYSFFDSIYKVFNLNFYKKINFHIYIFSKKKKRIIFIKHIRKELEKLKKIYNMRIFINFKFIFFLIFLQSIIS